jgi:preprotein translocase subunit SecF
MSFTAKVKHVYEHKYKTLMILPILLLLLALIQIGYQTYTTGDFLHRGVSLKGGSTITIDDTNIDVKSLEQVLKQQFPNGEVTARTLYVTGQASGVSIETSLQDNKDIEALTSAIEQQTKISKDAYSTEVMGAALGSSFFKQAGLAMLVSFALMGIVVILYFRIWIPSLAVILCAFSDIVVTMAIFNLTGMQLSTAGVAAFLMLIGYSIDTDILLTSRVLHRKEGTVMEKVYGAITTGMTMTFTTMAAVGIALIFVQSEAIRQIMFIVLIGLVIDMIMTWVQNVGILRWYLERKETAKEVRK